jgi:hypothetical protein
MVTALDPVRVSSMPSSRQVRSMRSVAVSPSYASAEASTAL